MAQIDVTEKVEAIRMSNKSAYLKVMKMIDREYERALDEEHASNKVERLIGN